MFFNGDGVKKSIFKQIGERSGYGGITSDYRQIAFVNLREIRDIKFGTRGRSCITICSMGRIFGDFAYGSFTIQIGDPVLRFIHQFRSGGVTYYKLLLIGASTFADSG